MKAALQARFHTTLIEVRQPAVVCHFSDGDVEVVPCFSAGDGGYWIPDPVGTWMKTYPNVHNDYVTAVNKKHGGGAKALARQLKIWKYKLNVPVSSCYLEMRAAKHLDGESVYAPLTDLAMMLSKLQEKKLRAMNDPTGSGARFTAYSSDAKGATALSKLGTAVSRVQKAHGCYVDDDDAGAITQLRLLFDHSY